jgi:hypothetical protein
MSQPQYSLDKLAQSTAQLKAANDSLEQHLKSKEKFDSRLLIVDSTTNRFSTIDHRPSSNGR